LDPGAVLLRRPDAGIDECDPLDAVGDGWEHHVLRRLLAAARGADGARGLGIDVGKSLQIAFRMAGRDAGDARSGGPCAGSAPRDQPLLAAERRKPKTVRVLLPPFEPAPGSVDP